MGGKVVPMFFFLFFFYERMRGRRRTRRARGQDISNEKIHSGSLNGRENKESVIQTDRYQNEVDIFAGASLLEKNTQ